VEHFHDFNAYHPQGAQYALIQTISDARNILYLYAYGYLSGEKRDSAVFWCQKAIGDQREFYLIAMIRDDGHELAKCPRRIRWRNYPGGLEIFHDPRMALDCFHYMNDPDRKVPRSVKATHNAIRSAAGGVQEIFYCYRGEWLVRMLD
jgi:hypothetical protein